MVAGGASVKVGGRGVKNPSQFSFVKLDPGELAALLNSEGGPIARDLIERGERVKNRARQLVGVSKPDPVPRRKPHRPGTLRDRIVKRMSIQHGKLVVEVGADVPYAFFHHEGWPGGIIIMPKKSKFLVFYWPKNPWGLKNAIYRLPRVTQGSFKGNPFLKDALPAAKG